MSEAIQEAAVVVCFMTPKYQNYPFYRKELQYACNLRKPIIPCLLTPNWQQSDWLGFVVAGCIWLNFSDISDDNRAKKLQRLHDFIHILTKDAFKVNAHNHPGALMVPQQEETIHMILIGRAGSGKTYLGNAILGERQFDLSVSTHSAIGEKYKVGFRYFHQQKAKLIVIDTPGFFNNEDDVERSVRVTITDGSCAILLLLSIEFGLTNQEEKMLDTLTNMYGERIFQHIIVVFTGLDKIEGELQTFINEQCSSSLKQFLARCGHRYMGIKNNHDQPTDKHGFVSNLIHVIDTMPRLSSNHLA